MLKKHIKNAATYGELSLKIVKILTENLETGRKSLLQPRLLKKKKKKKESSALTLAGGRKVSLAGTLTPGRLGDPSGAGKEFQPRFWHPSLRV